LADERSCDQTSGFNKGLLIRAYAHHTLILCFSSRGCCLVKRTFVALWSTGYWDFIVKCFTADLLDPNPIQLVLRLCMGYRNTCSLLYKVHSLV